jgi:hypothetical protein
MHGEKEYLGGLPGEGASGRGQAVVCSRCAGRRGIDELDASLLLQRTARGFIARRRVLRSLFQRAYTSLVRLQAWFRGMIARARIKFLAGPRQCAGKTAATREDGWGRKGNTTARHEWAAAWKRLQMPSSQPFLSDRCRFWRTLVELKLRCPGVSNGEAFTALSDAKGSMSLCEAYLSSDDYLLGTLRLQGNIKAIPQNLAPVDIRTGDTIPFTLYKDAFFEPSKRRQARRRVGRRPMSAQVARSASRRNILPSDLIPQWRPPNSLSPEHLSRVRGATALQFNRREISYSDNLAMDETVDMFAMPVTKAAVSRQSRVTLAPPGKIECQ